MSEPRQPIMQMRGISKSFGGLRALIDVDLELYPNEILALVGDNGAGKSTLIKILTGVYSPDSGEINVDGRKVEILDRRTSMDAGVGVVYQNLGLVDSLPPAANVFLGNELTAKFLGITYLDNSRMKEEAARILLEKVGVQLDDMDGPTVNLSGGQRQAVAIARAVYNTDLKVLVLDEPTAALGPEETRNTLNLIKSVRDRGIAVIVVSHNLEHVFAVADRVQVMRGGRRAGVLEISKATRQDVLGLIIGSEAPADAMA
jgi:ABC-type sugar transport system ATPase subunit